MYAVYGSYTHTTNEVGLLSFTQRTKYSPRGLIETTIKTATLEVLLIPATATQAGVKTAIEALEAAYGRDGQDFALFHDDGTRSPHSLISSQSIGGVRVLNLDFPKGDGAEYATQRTATITLEAEFPASSGALLMFEESLRFVGNGGARYRHVETLNGPPQKQLLTQRTIARCSQSGSAVGLLSRPSPPPPIWPQLELYDLREISVGGPRFDGRVFRDWPVSWSYQFESGQPLFGEPHRQ